MDGPHIDTLRIVLLDPDRRIREETERRLEHAGCPVHAAAPSAATVSEAIASEPDAVLLGLADEAETVRWLERIRRESPRTSVLVLAEPARLRHAIACLSRGASDYLIRPPDPAEIRTRLGALRRERDLDSRVALYRDQLARRKTAFEDDEVRSPAMRAVVDRIARVAPMRSTALVIGESGVGKELVARSIHFSSPRREQPFVALNCAAMPDSLIESELFGHEKGAFTGAHSRSRGKFEIADRGTLFLDEIGEMNPATQAKLLRVLEAREFMRIGGSRSITVDVRLIAATNADLEAMVADGSFRRDLYYRLKVVTIRVPPLRERRPDLPHLVDTFLEQLARANAIPAKTISPDAVAVLQQYAWPGNVRELKNVLESILVASPGRSIEVEDLPDYVHASPPPPRGALDLAPGMTLEQAERDLIAKTLEHTGGNRTHSALLLGIGVRTLQRKIQTYGIDIAPRRRRPRRRPEP